MNQKIAGLYVNLAKALNALEEAQEDPYTSGLRIEGLSAVVRYRHDTEQWVVADEA